jgi:phytoene dehydrogenase-like protein
MPEYDAVVVGSGPNGLASAIALARTGLSTLLLEGAATPGGGARTSELTLPGFLHDDCSSVHPLGVASPFFRSLGLEQYGLSWIQPDSPLAHLLAPDSALLLERSVESTAEQLGADAGAYRALFGPLVRDFERLMPMILGPLHVPAAPLLLARFGLAALPSLRGLCRRRFQQPAVEALLAGMSAQARLPLTSAGTAAFALVLGAAAHAVGWPIARGGSAAISGALLACLEAAGGELRLNHPVRRRSDLPAARAYLFDVTPRQLIEILGDELPQHYSRRLQRFRYGPGVYKLDWALRAPIPWRDPRCARAATVHLGGSLEEVGRAEAAVHAGRVAQQPFVLLVQPSLFDPSRAPPGLHTAWAYCHVPHGSEWNASAAIEARVEHFAPGFRDLVLARAAKNALEMERYNPNYVGGDINGGSAALSQLLFRPMVRLDPYATPLPDVFLCSSSTPPGGGVHGMCGYWAARSVARRVFQRSLQAHFPDDCPVRYREPGPHPAHLVHYATPCPGTEDAHSRNC